MKETEETTRPAETDIPAPAEVPTEIPKEETPAPDPRAAFAALLTTLPEGEKATLLAALCAYVETKKENARRAEEEALYAEMEAVPAFAGIGERRGAIEALIARVGWLAALPPRERLATALTLDRGMTRHTPTKEEALEALLADEELLRALAERQAAGRVTGAPAVPRHGRTPATVQKPPQNLAEAGKAARHFFHV